MQQRKHAHEAERPATMQAPDDLVEWLWHYGFHREAVAAVESMVFMVEPTLAITQANVDALKSVLRMDDAQVRVVRARVAAAACCSRTSWSACACTSQPPSREHSCLELLYHRLQHHPLSQHASRATARARNDAYEQSHGALRGIVRLACVGSSA